MSTIEAKAQSLGRRRVPRRSFEAQVGVLAAGVYNMERLYQVGEGGMMISSAADKLTLGRQVVVSFFLRPEVPVVVRGVVRSVIPAEKGLPERYGLEFETIEFSLKREIRNFVASATQFDGRNS